MTNAESIGDAPVDHVFCRLAAAGTGLAELLLPEGDAAGGHAALFLHLLFAGLFTAPHGLDEAAVLALQRLCLFDAGSRENMLLQVLQGGVIQTLLHGIEKRGKPGLQLIQRDGRLFAVVTAHFQPRLLSEKSACARMPAA